MLSILRKYYVECINSRHVKLYMILKFTGMDEIREEFTGVSPLKRKD